MIHKKAPLVIQRKPQCRIRPRMYPELENREWLRQRFVDEKKTREEIRAEVGCSMTVVEKALKNLKLYEPPRPVAKQKTARQMIREKLEMRKGSAE
jgi:hypothetical protein